SRGRAGRARGSCRAAISASAGPRAGRRGPAFSTRRRRAIRQPDGHRPLTAGQQRLLSGIVCGAGPAAGTGSFVALARERGWAVQVIATPSALGFFDAAEIEKQSGGLVRSEYAPSGSPRSQLPDAVVVAPATYNSICKWAQGISDTYALGVLAE